MSDFKVFRDAVSHQISEMTKNNEKLFLVDIDKDELWNTYLESYPEGTNNIYITNREYDCSSCRHFIKRYGGLVTISENNKLISIWKCFGVLPYPFNIVAERLHNLVKSKYIRNIFTSTISILGIEENYKDYKNGDTVDLVKFDHFYYKLKNSYVYSSSKENLGIYLNEVRDTKNVFERSMKELTLDAGNTILELISQGSLYRGNEYKDTLDKFIYYKFNYDKLKEKEKDNWLWSVVGRFKNPQFLKFRNTVLGTLLIDISNDVDIDEAVRKWETAMAPTNYKRPKAIYTKKMVEEAEKKIEDLGLAESLPRRFAVLDDININDVLFINRDVDSCLESTSVFDSLKSDISDNAKKFSKVEEIEIDKFIDNILPNISKMELLVESKHQNNFVSLIAPLNKGAKNIFKWKNNFSWSYKGDITDSMKQRVKSAGGNIDGVLRFSIQWNDGDNNPNDFDAHCMEPGGLHIYFGNKKIIHPSSGSLDVDIINPGGRVAVENIVYTDINKMVEGIYHFYVHNYNNRGGDTGFTAEIEFNGDIYSFDYPRALKQNESVTVAKVKLKDKEFKIVSSLDSSCSSKDVWGIKTNKFIPVSSFMLSPNYWGESKEGVGNKHYFFFMKDCKAEAPPRGIYNEFLDDSLITHKRVFEALGAKMRVEASNNQLSGLGFSTTKRDKVVVKVEGNFKRTLKLLI